MDTSITIKPLNILYPLRPRSGDDSSSATEGETGRASTDKVQELSPEELRLVEQLKQRDREVRSHELAHKAIAGQYARGAPSFEYRIGPDGRRYAVGGEVSIDIGKANDPRETLRKAEVIRSAAMAPADPSMQDRQIAMQASAMAAEARHELQLQEEQTEAASDREGTGQETTQPLSSLSGTEPSVSHAKLSVYRVLSSNPHSTHTLVDQIA